MRPSRTISALGVLAVLLATPALAHNTDTHLNLTARAVEYLQQNDERFECDEPLFDLLALLEVGAVQEAAAVDPSCADGPACEVRFMQHYLPRLDDGTGSSSCSMLQWGFGSGECYQSLNGSQNPLVNSHNWQAAIDNVGSEQGWEELGYLLHLLQSLSTPSHARNDAHPHAPLAGDPLGGADVFESTVLDVTTFSDDGLIAFDRPEEFFLSFSEYVQQMFYSQDSVFDDSLSGPVSASVFATERLVDGENDPAEGEPYEDENYFYGGDGMRIAFKGDDYVASAAEEFDTEGNRLRDLTAATIDEVVAMEQWERLGPQAVRFGASLLQYYHDVAGALPPCDNTPPEITAVVEGTEGDNGWYVSDVTVTWTVEDPETGVVSSEGCDPVTLTEETTGTTLTCSATNGAGLTNEESITIKIDKSAPEIAPVVEGTLGNNGWYVSDVTVSWTVEDAISGIAMTDGCETTELTEDTPGVTLTCMATNGAGLSSSSSVTVKIDKTPPVVSGLPEDCTLWPPNHKLVKVATVTATDNLSGIAMFEVSGTSNEPEGRKRPDIVIRDGDVYLRSERLGSGSGRVYTITGFAEDAAGNQTTEQGTCVVPHDQRSSNDFRTIRSSRSVRPSVTE
jgi:hypothetical protein